MSKKSRRRPALESDSTPAPSPIGSSPLDRERTKRFPELFVRKLQRMSSSPLAYLRGAAPLFYEILAARPELASGPAGEGWIVGDMHLENFGAYRPDPLGAAEPASSETTRRRTASFAST